MVTGNLTALVERPIVVPQRFRKICGSVPMSVLEKYERLHIVAFPFFGKKTRENTPKIRILSFSVTHPLYMYMCLFMDISSVLSHSYYLCHFCFLHPFFSVCLTFISSILPFMILLVFENFSDQTIHKKKKNKHVYSKGGPFTLSWY